MDFIREERDSTMNSPKNDQFEVENDECNLVIESWGVRPGKVIGVIRQHLGLDIYAVKELREKELPVVATGSIRDLYILMCALESAGARIRIIM